MDMKLATTASYNIFSTVENLRQDRSWETKVKHNMEHGKKGPSDGRGGGRLDNISFEVEMGLDELLV
jgi:hypothetical protein